MSERCSAAPHPALAMAHLLSLVITCAFLPATLGAQVESTQQYGNTSDGNVQEEPLNMESLQTVGGTFSCQSPYPNPSQLSLSCSAQCPSCPGCPPALICPSPCPDVPKCPDPQVCPSPCKACPACPSCKRIIPPGYEYFEGLGYYRLHNVPVNWYEAKATCEREGAHLAIINSEEEAELMKQLFHRDIDIGTVLFMGFHELYVHGRWVTIFGQPLAETGFTTWSYKQPDNPDVEHCGSIFNNGLLNDVLCASPWPFVCELST